MPLIYVQQYSAASYTPTLRSGGTQHVDGVLSFNGATTIYLNNGAFPQSGRYILFDYSGGGSFPGGQTALDSNVTVDVSNLILSGGYTLTDNVASSQIYLDLASKTDNGTQFVDGNLDFPASGTSLIYLSDDLYQSPGTYTLFSVTGTVSNLSNLVCIPMKSGLTANSPVLVPGSPNIITVTLSA